MPAHSRESVNRSRRSGASRVSTGNRGVVPTSPQSMHFSGSFAVGLHSMRSQTQLSAESLIGKRSVTSNTVDSIRWADGTHKSPAQSVTSRHQKAAYHGIAKPAHEYAPGVEGSFELEGESSEAPENVRACCEGKHDVGTLRQPPEEPRQSPAETSPQPTTPAVNPSSPSARSFRSKAGSLGRLRRWVSGNDSGPLVQVTRTRRGKGETPGSPIEHARASQQARPSDDGGPDLPVTRDRNADPIASTPPTPDPMSPKRKLYKSRPRDLTHPKDARTPLGEPSSGPKPKRGFFSILSSRLFK